MMKKTMISALLILLALGSTMARAEDGSKFWIVPAAGIRTSSYFGIESEEVDYSRIRFDSGFAYGLSAGYRLSEFLAVEALWSRLDTTVEGVATAGDPPPPNETLFDATEDQFHANLIVSAGYSIGAVKPYFLVGLGVTAVNPAGDAPGVTRFSWSLGMGFDTMFSKRIGARVQGKFVPTYINTTEQILFEWTGGYQATSVRNNITQWEVTAGLIYRF